MSEIINYLLQEEPTYKDTSADFVAMDLYEKVGAPSGYSKEQFYSDILQYQEPGFAGEFGKGLERSGREMGISATTAFPAAAAIVGEDLLRAYGVDTSLGDVAPGLLEKGQEKKEQLYKQLPPLVTHRSEVEDLQDLAQYAGNLAGSGIGSSLDVLGSALVGGGAGFALKGGLNIVAKQGMKAAARKAGVELSEDQIQKQLKGTMGKAFKNGAALGAMGRTVTAEGGSTYESMLAEGEDSPGVAIMAGAIKGALENVAEFGAVARLFKSPAAKEALKDATVREVLKRNGINFAKEVGKVSGTEAATEAAQQAVDIAALDFVTGNETLFSAQGLDQLIEAGIAGAIGGAPLGAVSGGAQLFKPGQVELPQIHLSSGVTQPKATAAAVEEEIELSDALNPSSPNFNEEVASRFSTKSKDTSPINPEEAATVLQEKVDSAPQQEGLVASINAQLDDTAAKLAPLQEFNKEVQLGRLEGLSASEIAEVDPETFAPKAAPKSYTVFRKPTSKGVLPEGAVSYTKKPNDYAQQEVALANPLEAANLSAAKKVLNLPKEATLKDTITAATNAGYDGLVAGDAVYASPLPVEARTVASPSQATPVAATPTEAAPEANLGQETAAYNPASIDQVVTDANTGVISASKAKEEAAKLGYEAVVDGKTGGIKARKKPTPKGQAATQVPFTPESVRAIPLKQKADAAVQQIQDLIKSIAGPAAQIDMYESLTGVDPNNNEAQLRGAQWGNVIAVALNTNENLGTSARETALHEAFHFLYSNALSNSDRNRIESAKKTLTSYIAKEMGLPQYDIELFDAEEIGATAFGIWADKKADKGNLGSAREPFNKLKNIFKSISNLFRKSGIKGIEDLFENIYDGRYALDTMDEVLNNERVIRAQQAIANAKGEATNYILTPQAYVSEAKLKSMFGKTPALGMLDFTNWQNFKTTMFNTSPGLANKDPVWSAIFNVVHSKDKNLSVYESIFANLLRDLYDNPARMDVAGEVMDHLSQTNQNVTTDSKGRVYYTKGKKVIFLSQAASEDVLALHKAFQNMLKLWRDNSNTKLKEAEGFDTIDEAIAHQEEILATSSSPVAKVLSNREKVSAERRLDQLKQTKETLDKIESILESNKAYFPRLANGRYGMTIRLVGKEGAPLRQGFAMIGEDLNGKPDKKQIQEVVKRWEDELGYKGSKYSISEPFELNRNDLYRAIGGQSNLNLDLLVSVLSSKNPALVDEIQGAVDDIKGSVAKSYVNPRFLEQRDLLLYSKDYKSVIPAYFSNGTRSVNNYRYAEATKLIQEFLDNGVMQVGPEERIQLNRQQKELYQDLFGYISSPSTDMAGLRAFNFFWALGGNITTGILQLVTLPTFVTGVMNTYTGNPISNNAIIAKNFAKVSAMLTDSKFDINKFGDSAFLQKHINDPEMVKAIQIAYARGEFKAARSEDMLGDRAFTSGRAGSGGFINWAGDKAKTALAFPIQTGEELSRLTAFMSLYETLKADPKAIKNFEDNFTKGDNRYSFYKELNSDIDPEIYAALYAIDSTHGLFGKLGRGKNQQGIYGSLLFPFMQHPLMMMGLMNRLIQGNAVNKQAAAYIILSTMLLAGMYGIPGWELWKEAGEMLVKQTTGREVDFHNYFKEALVVGGGLPPSVGEGITEGALKPLGIDISRRVGMPIFFQDAIMPLLQGRGGADQFAGVAGSNIRTALSNYDRMASGELSPGGAIMESLAPTAFKNMYKALAVWPEEGIRTGQGNQIMTPDEITPGMQLAKFIGFQPSQVSREYEKRAVERGQGTGWRLGYDRRVGTISRRMAERNKLEAAKENTSELDAEIDSLIADLYKFAQDSNVPITKDFTSGLRNSLARRMVNTIEPDAIQREYKNVDYSVLDLIYERE